MIFASLHCIFAYGFSVSYLSCHPQCLYNNTHTHIHTHTCICECLHALYYALLRFSFNPCLISFWLVFTMPFFVIYVSFSHCCNFVVAITLFARRRSVLLQSILLPHSFSFSFFSLPVFDCQSGIHLSPFVVVIFVIVNHLFAPLCSVCAKHTLTLANTFCSVTVSSRLPLR